MQKKDNYIDLHIHTLNSDGQFSPQKIVDLAYDNDTNFISVTDHDSINGINQFKENLKIGMLGVNGVEFSSYIVVDNKKIKLHILGYCFDENNEKLQYLLNEMRAKRIKSHLKLLNNVKEELLSLPEKSLSMIDIEKYCWFDREFIKCLENENYSPDIIEYYRKFFKQNRFSYGADYDLDVKRVIDGIKSANGFVVLAHPMAYKLNREEVEKIIINLVNLGIDGIETYQSDCSFDDSLYLSELAHKYNLLESVGSDFHRVINSDGRIIGKGINENLCIKETTLTDKILENKKYFIGRKK